MMCFSFHFTQLWVNINEQLIMINKIGIKFHTTNVTRWHMVPIENIPNCIPLKLLRMYHSLAKESRHTEIMFKAVPNEVWIYSPIGRFACKLNLLHRALFLQK